MPGRLRIRLSHALNWPERVRRLVAEHAGVAEVRYTAVSRSLLVRFDVNYISTEEILVRVATGFSLERDYGAVRILTRPPTPELSNSAFYSGIALIAAFAWRLARGYANPNVALEYATGLATAGAVLNHGWMDYRSQGNFDPELLAVTYLLAALARGNPLPAAAITWISSFGRHLIRLPARGIVVRPALTGYEGVTPIFEVIVAPDPTPPDKITFFGFLPTLAFRAMTARRFFPPCELPRGSPARRGYARPGSGGRQRFSPRHPPEHSGNGARRRGTLGAKPISKEALTNAHHHAARHRICHRVGGRRGGLLCL